MPSTEPSRTVETPKTGKKELHKLNEEREESERKKEAAKDEQRTVLRVREPRSLRGKMPQPGEWNGKCQS